MRERVVLVIPATVAPGEAYAVRDAASAEIAALVSCYGLAPVEITLLREGAEAALVVGDSRRTLGQGSAAGAEAYHAGFAALLWPALLAPALAARGITPGWWLRQAARGGLRLAELDAVGRGNPGEDVLALRLAERPAPELALAAGADARSALAEEAVRRAAAQEAADRTGLPVVVPAGPAWNPERRDDEAMLVLGAWRSAPFAPTALADALSRLAPAMVHPGAVLAMLADESRMPRRLAARAIAEVGPVTIARRMIDAADSGGRADLRSIAEAALGVAPVQ
ncbi:hypothetical protein [Elioraea rosea]|uniref:hypothetical protein n=1 Tax=Elioraea rosea TaxID=2492390 RepID=UPI00118364C0|nr:hypothetical protein [Elioraea rosea]